MTFADKKVEELKDFTIQCKGLPVDSERGILDAKNSKGVEISNFLKQTIAEAEREGQLEAYNDVRKRGLSGITNDYCKTKLKELGA
jgi:hypothetical protein